MENDEVQLEIINQDSFTANRISEARFVHP